MKSEAYVIVRMRTNMVGLRILDKAKMPAGRCRVKRWQLRYPGSSAKELATPPVPPMRNRAIRLNDIRRLLSLRLPGASFALSSPINAQGLRDRISELFIFGGGQEPLFLAGIRRPEQSGIASGARRSISFLPRPRRTRR